MFDSNINWVEVDRAAKIRAATAVVKPDWWIRWNGGSIPSLKEFFGEDLQETGNEDFDLIVSNSLSDIDLVARYKTLEESGWLEANDVESSSQAVQTCIQIIKLLVRSIRYSGNFTVINQWIYVLQKYWREYNVLMSQTTLNLEQARAFVARARAVQTVAFFNPRSIDETREAEVVTQFSPVLASIFNHQGGINKDALGRFYIHFHENSQVDAYLAEMTFDRLISNLGEKASPHSLENR